MPLREQSPLPAAVLSALARGATVLTASTRAARFLRRLYAEHARAQGQDSWPAPAIHDWSAWLQSLHASLADAPALLNPLQEEQLWRRAQASDAAGVVSPARLAELAQSAYALLSRYHAHWGRRAPWAASHEDAERFLDWAQQFDASCTELNTLPCAELERFLQTAFTSGTLPPATLPRELLLVGFDRLLPAQSSLLRALQAANIPSQLLPCSTGSAQPQLVCAADEESELLLCAQWARSQLEANPAQRIAILLPELQGARPRLDRILRRTLLPQSAARAASTPLPYEFSLGTPLAQMPVIAAALLLLRWLAGPLPSAEITSLLTGGFAATDAPEAARLSEADVLLRRKGLLTVELDLRTLLAHAARHPGLLPPGFLVRFQAAELWAHREVSSRRTHSEWVEAAEGQLAALAWPGYRELGSVPYQACQRWAGLLQTVATLGFAGARLTWAQFVGELRGYAQATVFSPESHDAPIQILGAAEASGQAFDALWFLGLTDRNWPTGGRLHPLLAPTLQRDAGMPHSTSEADYELGREQMERILSSAPVVVCSYAAQGGSSAARPSPLLLALGTLPAPTQASAPETPLEAICEPELPVPLPWPTELPVGSDALRRQAACGFQSFAVRRLRADPLDEEAWGLDALERGTLLHRTLELLWSPDAITSGELQLHTRDDLQRALGEGTIDAMLDRALERAFSRAVREAASDRWLSEYLLLEQRRLGTRLRKWLEVEQDREPFMRS